MKNKKLMLGAFLLLTVSAAWCQDTSKISPAKKSNNNVNTLAYPDSGMVNLKRKQKAHSSVNSNEGIIVPSTTSGTLSSNVNPNTQLVIPIRKHKRKSNDVVIPDSGTKK
jgi:hypothetical protein